MIFKLLILQSLCNLSDDQMEYQIADRLSFKWVLVMKSSDLVPDSKKIWKLCETLIQEEVIEILFYRFNQALDDLNILQRRIKLSTPLLLTILNSAIAVTKTNRSKWDKPRKRGRQCRTNCARKTLMCNGPEQDEILWLQELF